MNAERHPTDRPDRDAVVYDDNCAFCTVQVKWLKRLDWFGRFQYEPLSSGRALVWAPELKDSDLLAAMHVIPVRGGITRGARAVRAIALRLPLLVPLALLMWLPGVIYPAEWAYRRVAGNRMIISKLFGCTDESCTVHSKRK